MTTGMITLELPGHGEFKALIGNVSYFEKRSKTRLATLIAACYDGNDNNGNANSYRVTYWMQYSKSILCIVAAGLEYPEN